MKAIRALRVTQVCPGRVRLSPEMLSFLFVHIARIQVTLPIIRKIQYEPTAIRSYITLKFLDLSLSPYIYHLNYLLAIRF